MRYLGLKQGTLCMTNAGEAEGYDEFSRILTNLG